jgi:uncharacterized protein YjiS (DUF1127 family)
MAYSSLFDEQPVVAARPFHPLSAFAGWIAAARAKHAQRVALSNLLEFDAALLEDLGISRNDVVEALQHPHSIAGRTLAARRAESARDWLAHP